MTQDEIIEMARQAGWPDWEIVGMKGELKTFAKLVKERTAAKEREALLQIVYGYAQNLSWNDDFQDDIQARGEA